MAGLRPDLLSSCITLNYIPLILESRSREEAFTGSAPDFPYAQRAALRLPHGPVTAETEISRTVVDSILVFPVIPNRKVKPHSGLYSKSPLEEFAFARAQRHRITRLQGPRSAS
jgi:hypothetical protein